MLTNTNDLANYSGMISLFRRGEQHPKAPFRCTETRFFPGLPFQASVTGEPAFGDEVGDNLYRRIIKNQPRAFMFKW
jgi:hypothetical protein